MLYVLLPKSVELVTDETLNVPATTSTAQRQTVAGGNNDGALRCKLRPRIRCSDRYVQTVKISGRLFEYHDVAQTQTVSDGEDNWSVRYVQGSDSASTTADENGRTLLGLRFPTLIATPKGRTQDSEYFVKAKGEDDAASQPHSFDSEFLAFHPNHCRLQPDCISIFVSS